MLGQHKNTQILFLRSKLVLKLQLLRSHVNCPPRRLLSDTAANIVTHEHSYASFSTSVNAVTTETSTDDLMDISLCIDEENTPILADSTTQVSAAVVNVATQIEPVTMVDASTQTDSNCDNSMRRHLFVGHVTENNKNCRFWTGIETLSLLNFIFEWVLPCAEKVTLWMGKKRYNTSSKPRRRILSLFEEYLLVLVRIRRCLDTEEIGTLFGITQSHVTHIFITWVNLLYKCFIPLLEWPSSDIVRHNMPQSFRLSFPSTRVIIDCSEIFIQTPRSIDAQRSTYSSYKSHNTVKFLLGIAPSGQITYLSKLFVGSISDREIVKKSGFLDLIEWKDNVMADRGFNIRDLLLRKNAYLNIPAFSDGKQLSARAVGKSRKIASVRIHVERAMERLKNFKIIQGVIPLQLKNSLNQIMLICAVLSNLQEPLVKE